MGYDDLREITAGAFGGAAATVIEYPTDTIKVRLQDDGKRYGTALQCVRSIAKDEGIMNGFFRGLPAPVLGSAVETATLFFVYRTFVEQLQYVLHGTAVESDTEHWNAVALAGGVSGLVVSHVLTPAELIKCKMQIQNTLPPVERVYRNSWDCALAIYQRRGVKGLYRGHVAMLWREFIGCGCYFFTIQAVIRSLLEDGQRFHEASPYVHFIGGGLAGVAFWTSIYPVDVIKTKQQTFKADYMKLSFRQCGERLYRTEGVRGIFRGFGVTALRALPGNAVLIAVYERVNHLWKLAEQT